jgi:hypothetical protein
MKRIVLIVLLAGFLVLPAVSQAQEYITPGPWYVGSYMAYVVREGPIAQGETYLVGYVGRHLATIGTLKLSACFQAIDLQDIPGGGYGFAAMISEPTFIPHVDFLAKIGGANHLAVDESGDKKWGLLTGAGLNLHVGARSAFFVGFEAMQRESGPVDVYSLNGGICIYGVDDMLGSFWDRVKGK